MSFAYPFVLPFLLVPLILLHRVWRRPGPSVAVPFDHAGGSSGRGWKFALDLGESLAPLLLGVAILILAGPQQRASRRRSGS